MNASKTADTAADSKVQPATKSPSREQTPERAQRRPGPLANRGSKRGGGIVNLDAKKKQSKKDDKDKPKQKSGRGNRPRVNVNIAAMPEVEQPKSKPSEPKEKVQRPDIAITKSQAISKPGEAPLQDRLVDSKRKKKDKRRKGAGEPETVETAETKKTKGIGDARQSRDRSKRGRRNSQFGEERQRMGRRQPRRGPAKNTAAPRKEKVALELPCSVRSFSEAAGIPAGQVVKALFTEFETMATINAELDDEMAQLLAEHFDVEIEFKQKESLEDKLLSALEDLADEEEQLQTRPPVVTFLGHVDHGKTSLLDAIIGLDVVSGEAGGITQHIRAYSIEKDNKTISFVDTPGHEAFTEMRARGANVTDIAVLVVAADDGVMPQTEEAIAHAKAAGVPIIVALNKIDLPSANVDKAYQDLAQHELLPSEWGGEVEVIKTSAIKGDGLDELLETIFVLAELSEYTANPERPAMGTCLEAQQEQGRGVVAKLIVQNGTLRVGDVLVCGSAHGRVKALGDTLKKRVRHEEAGPSIPIEVTGFDVAPEAGDRFYVLDDISEAREIASQRHHRSQSEKLDRTIKVSFEEFTNRMAAGDLSDGTGELIKLNLIIRADVRGSIEAIRKEIGKIQHPEIQINILQASVGGVTVGDVTLADASQAVIVAFNVVPDESARSMAEDKQVEVRRYDIIYKVTDDIKALLEGQLKPEEKSVDTGSAMVLRTFSISRSGVIAGCRVMRGTIERDCRVRLIRDSRIIGDYGIDSLRREKDDVKEVRQGMECGIKLLNYNDIKEADTFEAYKIEEIARKLEN